MIRLVLALILGQAAATDRDRPFAITVVDEQTGRGVPLVELKTVNGIRFFTDSAGVVAFDEPGLLGQDVHFTIRSFGYTFPKDGFGIAGKTLKTVPGGSAELKIHRDILAERLYRTTGGGIYRDSVLVGRKSPIREPLLNARVLGQDSIQSVIFKDRILWFWGDTNRPSYPLGNFHMPGATSPLPSQGGLNPEVGIDLTYPVDKDGFARPTANMPGPGPTWLGGLTVLKDENGHERLFAVYDKIRNMLETYQRGLVEWDDEALAFRKLREFPLDHPLYPQGHPFQYDVNGKSYVYFPAPYPLVRVKAEVTAFLDFSQYEAFTPYREGSRGDKKVLERDPKGHVVYDWKKNSVPASPADLAALIRAGTLKESESIFPMRDIQTGKAVMPHGGSVQWNAYRHRWVMIFVEFGGKSMLGEVYFAEADSPLGPWAFCRKIATHADDKLVYSFYNPKHHAFLDRHAGRTIFFEGTYTTTFSGSTDPTPRYDYNQVMYRLDLSRPELRLPVPVYRADDGTILGPADDGHRDRVGRAVAFFAYDQPASGAIPVFGSENGNGELTTETTGRPPLFHALLATGAGNSPEATPLQESRNAEGRLLYAPEGEPAIDGFQPTRRSPGRVWPCLSKIVLPR